MTHQTEAENKLIEACIQEVCKEKNIRWKNLTYKEQNELYPYIVELYRTRKCEEAGKELPSDEIINRKYPHIYGSHIDVSAIDKQESAKWMRSEASLLLASKQLMIDKLFSQGVASLTEITNLQAQLEVKDKLLDEAIEVHNLSMDEKNKEIEELKDGCDQRSKLVMELTFEKQNLKSLLQSSKEQEIKRQIFIGRLSEIIGFEKSMQIASECGHIIIPPTGDKKTAEEVLSKYHRIDLPALDNILKAMEEYANQFKLI